MSITSEELMIYAVKLLQTRELYAHDNRSYVEKIFYWKLDTPV